MNHNARPIQACMPVAVVCCFLEALPVSRFSAEPNGDPLIGPLVEAGFLRVGKFVYTFDH